LYRAQQQLDGFLSNFPNRWMRFLLRFFIFPLGQPYSPPGDVLGHAVAASVLEPSATRDRLTSGIYITDKPDDPLGRIEHALEAVIDAAEAEEKLHRAQKAGVVTTLDDKTAIKELRKANLINEKEEALLRKAAQAVWQAIVVDAFDPKEL